MATRHFVPRDYPFAFTNGVQASWLEVDIDTGFVKLLKHWVVEDCGTIINPQLVDEQIRGGVVQGLGAALFEKCVYDERGQLTNANMADYLVPMSGEMPDIDIGHVVSPTLESEFLLVFMASSSNLSHKPTSPPLENSGVQVLV